MGATHSVLVIDFVVISFHHDNCIQFIRNLDEGRRYATIEDFRNKSYKDLYGYSPSAERKQNTTSPD
jgi:hypothetical protein